MTAKLPALRVERRTAFANSRDIAGVFGKGHFHVIRDIEKINPDLDASLGWFRLSDYLDAYGRSQKRYLMTRDGFALLVMGYAGEKALRFKVAYITGEEKVATGEMSEFPGGKP